MDDVMTRVERGAKWVDEHYPGRLDQIDLDSLDLGSCKRCVLGQIKGSFFDALPMIEMTCDEDSEWAFALRHGFAASSEDFRPRKYSELTAAWRAYLHARRASQTLSAPQPQHQDEGELVHA